MTSCTARSRATSRCQARYPITTEGERCFPAVQCTYTQCWFCSMSLRVLAVAASRDFSSSSSKSIIGAPVDSDFEAVIFPLEQGPVNTVYREITVSLQVQYGGDTSLLDARHIDDASRDRCRQRRRPQSGQSKSSVRMWRGSKDRLLFLLRPTGLVRYQVSHRYAQIVSASSAGRNRYRSSNPKSLHHRVPPKRLPCRRSTPPRRVSRLKMGRRYSTLKIANTLPSIASRS